MNSDTCCVCSTATGELIHQGLHDRLFGVPGEWSMTRCVDRRCDLVRLKSAPDAEAIVASYANYYTHGSAALPDAGTVGPLRRAYAGIKASYLSRRYGYALPAKYLPWQRWGALLYLFPIRRGEVDEEVRGIAAVGKGRLLDVGCGSGRWLLQMRALGWEVAGVDFDARAVVTARSKGLEVALGTLQQQGFPGSHFDVITLNHVIEHVPDPVEVLAECRRLLKPGGTLVLFTPNSAALAHRVLGRAWRGLEPPRHLQIFGPMSMRQALSAAGFQQSDVHSVNSRYIWVESLRLRYPTIGSRPWGGVVLQMAAVALTWVEQLWLLARADVGECLAVKAMPTASSQT